ncbi:pentapeptide repeat-containing protein [Desulfovibrio sp. JC022]|uniref:pentapeptide repeat-containing protein n=1 Tax=Desulfovibrio sp. JC022 TaxID=2593642 RepID=UPI0013D0C81B|nr:pentapeptide repeat-containing protein [Desulfovibrio sp. JC022]NDV22110.1 pentapeptide repeat-containing protein [Desulfovibrio sp. JC022]
MESVDYKKPRTKFSFDLILTVAFVCFIIVLSAVYVFLALDEGFDRERWKVVSEILRNLGLGLAGLYAATFGLMLAWRRTSATVDQNYTELYTKAIEHLGESENQSVNLGGIYALERIAQKSFTDHGPIIEVLTAYARENSPASMNASIEQSGIDTLNYSDFKSATQEVKAIAAVLRRRNVDHIKYEDAIDLTTVNLTSVNLNGAILADSNFSGSSLCFAHLERVDFSFSNLGRVIFGFCRIVDSNYSNASILGAQFFDSAIINTSFRDAKLNGCGFSLVKFDNVDFSNADLSNVNFREAQLRRCNFSGCKNLKLSQVSRAIVYSTCIFPSEFDMNSIPIFD